MEDWFDENDKDGVSFEKMQRERDWNKLKNTFLVEGFRNALDYSREETLQQGFDEGFQFGFHSSRSLSKLIGIFGFVFRFEVFSNATSKIYKGDFTFFCRSNRILFLSNS